MKRRFAYFPEAQREFDAIVAVLAVRNAAAAERWRDKFYATVMAIAETPTLGHEHPQVINRDLMAIKVKPYVIFYRYDAETVYIVRIVHGSRDLRSLL
jgi:plasmid stabilization system protein ParE